MIARLRTWLSLPRLTGQGEVSPEWVHPYADDSNAQNLAAEVDAAHQYEADRRAGERWRHGWVEARTAAAAEVEAGEHVAHWTRPLIGGDDR